MKAAAVAPALIVSLPVMMAPPAARWRLPIAGTPAPVTLRVHLMARCHTVAHPRKRIVWIAAALTVVIWTHDAQGAMRSMRQTVPAIPVSGNSPHNISDLQSTLPAMGVPIIFTDFRIGIVPSVTLGNGMITVVPLSTAVEVDPGFRFVMVVVI